MFIVKTASAHMPASCKGNYRRVAVIELEPGFADCSRIDSRDKAVKKIVSTWEGLNVGKTERSAYSKGLAEAKQMAAELNAARHRQTLAARQDEYFQSLVVEATQALRLLDGLIEEGEIASPHNTVECLRQILRKINEPTGYEPQVGRVAPEVDDTVPF